MCVRPARQQLPRRRLQVLAGAQHALGVAGGVGGEEDGLDVAHALGPPLPLEVAFPLAVPDPCRREHRAEVLEQCERLGCRRPAIVSKRGQGGGHSRLRGQ